MDFLFLIDCIVGTIFTFFHCLEAIYKELFKLPYKNLKGKKVLITGSGRGLGKETAIQLAQQGCQLFLTDINEQTVKETAEELNAKFGPGTAVAFKTDVSNIADIKKLNENVKKHGPLDILINNAGIVASNSLLEHTDHEIQRIVDVNLMSNIRMVKEFLPDMLENNEGHIVCISSIAAFSAAINTTPYFASKYAVTGFMQCVREELRSRKDNRILTTIIHPSFLNSAPINVNHWEVKSRMANLDIPVVASEIVEAIRMEKHIITVPCVYYFLLNFIKFLPQEAIDLWRDIYKTEIDNSASNKF